MSLATYITISRLIITIIILFLFYQGGKLSYASAFVLFLVAIFTDVLDGYIARKFKQVSSIGERLDPLVDKIMIHSIIFSLFYVGVYSPFIVFAMFFRDMLADGLRNHAYEYSEGCGANIWGKSKFVCQAASICFAFAYCINNEYAHCIILANVVLLLGLILSLPGFFSIGSTIFMVPPKSTNESSALGSIG